MEILLILKSLKLIDNKNNKFLKAYDYIFSYWLRCYFNPFMFLYFSAVLFNAMLFLQQ